MKEYILYTGCTTPVRHPGYEAATRAVLEKLGVHLVTVKGMNCCGAQYIESLNRMAFAAMGGRILALAEREGKDILAICGACSGSLKHNKHLLDTDKKVRDEVNSLLASEGLKYTGKVDVKHLLQVMRDDIGYDKIKAATVRPYTGIRLAAHYGCHVTRPYDIVKVDDPENPTVIDKIIEAVGATPVDYPGKTRCCGGPLLAMDQDLAGKIGMEKIRNVRSVGAQGIVTACVFCDIQLTQVQFGEDIQPEERIPVITLPQFMGPALGIGDQALGLYLTKISPDHILEALQEAKT